MKSKPIEQLPIVETISADDNQYLQELATNATVAQTMLRGWHQELGRRYGLGEGTQITRAGEIVRPPAEDARV